VLVALAGCAKKAPPPPRVAEVGVVTVTAAPVTVSTELTGRTTATLMSDVRPQVGGVVRERLFKEGSLVKAGQVLYRIDPRSYRAARDQASAALENARASYAAAQAQADRYQSLKDIDAVSRQQYDNTIAAARQGLAAVHQNEAALAAAEVNLDYTEVRAPITGRIGRSAVTPGALVTPGQTTALATIQQLDPIYVDVTQSSAQLLALRRSLAKGHLLPASAAVTLKLEDGTDYGTPGTLEFAEATVDANTGTVTLRARFPNRDSVLLPGMFVRLTVPEGVVPNAILVPQQGVARDPRGNATALVVGPDDKVVARPIEVRQAVGNRWLVTQGLSPGDRVVVEGTGKTGPGATVKPVAVTVDGS
jgi:membrane fusion protein (multidrug efflux system)